MPWTLQRYILGEMGRTFVLTAVALTGVLGMGGGLMHLVRLGEISGGQLLRLMLLTLPVATALTLPIAALFAAAATYGRLSANNEFVACRSSGINIHVLLLPSVLLSLVCTLVTFGLTNFIIPQMARNLETFLGQDLGDMIQRQLQRPQGWALGPYRVYSDYAPTVPGDPSLVVVRGVAFLRMENETWEIAGTAREAQLRFVRRNGRTYLEGHLLGLRGFDRRKGQAIDNEQLPFGPVPIPGPDLVKLKFLDLHQLLHYWQAPWEWREAQEALDDLRQALGRQRYYDDVERQWQDAGEVRLTGTNVTYGLRAPAAERRSETNALVLLDVDVEEQRPLLTMQYRAARAVFEVVAAERETGRWALRVELQDVQERAADGTSSPGLERKVLGPLAVADAYGEYLADTAPEALLAMAPAGAPPPVQQARQAAHNVHDETARKIVATLHERLAFSSSALLLVVLGAALGIIYRGAHLLTAFGISFMPSLLVFIAISAGKQMAQNDATPTMGLVIIWAGLLAVAVIDGFTLMRVLRR